MKVYLQAAIVGDLSETLPAGVRGIALWRRMTPLQKAVMLALVKLNEKSPELVDLFKKSEVAIYFSSAYGEISPMLRVTESIVEDSLPVSPKDFQHSVLNASIAYYCMQIASHQAGFAISGSFESADLALELAAKRIDAGLEHAAILIHAEETIQGSGESARAEILFLSSTRSPDALARLESFERSRDPFGLQENADLYDFEEGAQRRTPWLLTEGLLAKNRRLKNRDGEVFSTAWEIY